MNYWYTDMSNTSRIRVTIERIVMLLTLEGQHDIHPCLHPSIHHHQVQRYSDEVAIGLVLLNASSIAMYA